ncbi:murein hydrolase activator EnvC [Geobacter sp. DSM 9736]|uniref:murein hydrolase activator EnvC family protein n=1 Tax=Geobacter sp. DSM 9736 TaxID=1277350 RepID=UPI000B4FEB89|nr:peptidoglycan DD-metalloendopeptidase family protein [Geobacter sp. DSM 9736]SNB45287.1 Septal ring factor EnvC, activator of murein hydrolases AmiA and AmiB [Geobacter sp. DSM 9736]
MNKKTSAILLLLGFVAASPLHADLTKDLQGIKNKIKEKKTQLSKTKKVETKVSGELQQIEKNLREKEENLSSLNRDLKGVETGLDRTRKEIDVVQQEAQHKEVEIRQRVVSIYKAGEFGALRMFFSSESFPQVTENLRYMNSVLQNDRKLFDDYNAKISRLKGLKQTLEIDIARKEKIKTSIVAKKQEIEVEKKRKADYLLKIREEKKGHLASLRELEGNAKRLQSMVERLEARSRKSYSRKPDQPKRQYGQSLPPTPDRGFASQKGRLAMPVKGEVVATFGRHKHPEFNSYTVSNGISIAAPAGTVIRPVYDGQVVFADYFKGYGNLLIIDHGGGFFSLYGHASKILKKAGSMVSRQDAVATVGDVDSARGPVLYFEIRQQGRPVDPLPWF